MTTTRNPWFWRGMAEKAHVAAAGLSDRELRMQMLAIAAAYWSMAKRAQMLAGLRPYSRRPPPPRPANANQAA